MLFEVLFTEEDNELGDTREGLREIMACKNERREKVMILVAELTGYAV